MGILIDIINGEQLCDLMCGKPEDEMYDKEMMGKYEEKKQEIIDAFEEKRKEEKGE